MKMKTAKARFTVFALAAVIIGLLTISQVVSAQEGAATSDDEMKLAIQARNRRLSIERQQVVQEISNDIMLNYDQAKVSAAKKVLLDNPRNSWQDNARRICQAFAIVDKRFGKAWELLNKGDYKSAIAILKPLISQRDTTYFAAAKRFCYAEALAGAGRLEDAIDAYTDLVKDMPDRFSFSAIALLRAARMYDKMHRYFYAMSLYKFWVSSFGILDPKTANEISARANEIEEDYRDPLGTLAKKMSKVKQRLSSFDTGKETQKTEQEIVAMLDDLIATAEENASSQQGSSGGKKKGKGKGKGEGKGKSKGKGGKKGRGKRPRGIIIPSSHAAVSALTGGMVQPRDLGKSHPIVGTSDWGRLPPMQRKKLLESFKQGMPEIYRDMIRDYYKKLATTTP